MENGMGKHENQPSHKLGRQIGRHMKKGNIKSAFPQLFRNFYILALL